ncbi:L-idonate 5-dehydrogenase [Streptomyces sp. NBC_00670]|uniref:L-idonate 5-dehydrogenase n=1 Tax=Streptomyces sp. NBC_00670 TaxID=2975804 RepID=UPI002E34D323|nr:L-idonate 5-dehydrogenase [Streptomyces sp. NBC_00670]
MKAVVVHGAGDLRIDQLPDPVPGPGEVLVAMEWGGICGSDLAYWRHGGSGTAVLKHPMVLGHEVAGRVVRTGPGVRGFEGGQPVAVHPARVVGDEVLPERIAGRTNLHARVRYFGSAAFDPHTDGGFSELKAVPAGQLRVLPDGVSTRDGALAEPLAVALHAVHRAGDLRGRTVLVNGVGPIGSLVVAAARLRGAGAVVAADIAESSLGVARALGAGEVRNTGRGERLPDDVEVVFEASGAPGALGPVLRATARGGTVVQVGNLPGAEVPAVLGELVTREITWVGSYRFVDEIGEALRALGEGLDLSPLVTHEFGIERAGEALVVAGDRGSGSGKVMLRLGGGAGGVGSGVE